MLAYPKFSRGCHGARRHLSGPSTGFVVDDAIVMIENSDRYLEAGENPLAPVNPWPNPGTAA
jgi:hypothetical protein